MNIRLKEAIPEWTKGTGKKGSLNISQPILEKEEELKQFLRLGEKAARKQLKMGPHDGIRIRYVGISDLLTYLGRLSEVNPGLLRHVCSPSYQFAYDAPKFVESLIRLARGSAPHLARFPCDTN